MVVIEEMFSSHNTAVSLLSFEVMALSEHCTSLCVLEISVTVSVTCSHFRSHNYEKNVIYVFIYKPAVLENFVASSDKYWCQLLC